MSAESELWLLCFAHKLGSQHQVEALVVAADDDDDEEEPLASVSISSSSSSSWLVRALARCVCAQVSLHN